MKENDNLNQDNDKIIGDEKRPSVDTSFEKLLHAVGADGKYQWKLILIFMVPLSLFYRFASSNYVLLMSTQDHFCHVPGRNLTNQTLEEWHNETIPWEKQADGQYRLSKCRMYNMSLDEDVLQNANITIIDCQYGWDYDKSTWTETPVSKFNGVCDNKKMVPIIFGLNLAGGALGCLSLALLSDKFGRKPIFYVATIINLTFGLLLIHAPSFAYFGIFIFLAALGNFNMYQLPYILVSELCSPRLRNVLTFATFSTFILSNFYVSFIGWVVKDYRWFILATQLPVAIFILYWRFIPESPRWLLSRGKLKECEKTLREMALVNGVKLNEDLGRLLVSAHKEQKKKVHPKVILTSFVLTKHQILGALLQGLGVLTAICMNLNVHNMPGNVFINYVAIRTFELPGNVVGSFGCNYLGRRLSIVLIMILAMISAIICSFLLTDVWGLLFMVGVTKMFLRAEIYVIYLQIGELLPTPLRGTAYGISGISTSFISILAPFIVALASVNNSLVYYVVSALSLLTAFIGTFLPETLGLPLPQTLEEGMNVGKGQKYFHIIHKWNVDRFHSKYNSDKSLN